jgi:CubicO group peptidase (beta-lactamase class C family)
MIKLFSKSLAIIFLFTFVVNNIYGQRESDYSAKIDSLIQTKSPRSFNGIIWLTQKGKTKYLKTYGYSNFETKTPFALKDNFRIQSMSKQITAVIILREVEKGRIDLHIPIRKYLPDLKQTWADTVTVHHLLNNSSGIVNITKPLSFRPGTDYYYSNPGYGLLSPIIEQVAGKTFIEVANSLFKELKMHNSYCYQIDKPNVGLVNGYRVSKDSIDLFNFKALNHTPETWANFIPAGGMISNAIDLNLWDKKLHNGKILKPETYKLMTNYKISAQHESFGNEKVGYGYGLRISDKTPVKYLGHSGKGLGFMSIKIYIPAKDVSLIVLQNYYDADSTLHYYFESRIREIVINSSLVK